MGQTAPPPRAVATGTTTLVRPTWPQMTSSRPTSSQATSPQPTWRSVLAFAAVLTAGLAGCASTSPSQNASPPEASSPAAGAPSATLPPPLLRGARCEGRTSCACRKPGDDLETVPPAPDMKRLEIRMSFHGGNGSLSSPAIGQLPATDVAETCYYVDVPAGSTSAVRFDGRASNERTGFSPRLSVSEYGPAGPFWYEVLTVECVGVGGKCDRAGTDAWVATLRNRKRGRIDPCGSLVVTNLKWDTSGGLAHRDDGFYRDFQVAFDLDAKKFSPKFAPHSTECVPK